MSRQKTRSSSTGGSTTGGASISDGGSSTAFLPPQPATTTASQNAGIFFVVNGYSASDGSSFAILTNNGDVTQTIASSTFFVSNERVDFDWIYVTENAPKDATHKDPFTVTLTTTGPLGPTSTSWTVSNVDDTNLASGTIGLAPWNNTTTYDTGGWQTFAIDTTSLQGQTATITFTVNDSATGGATSGIFLDHVTHIQEPSTFVLFGVGFVGIALYGRRKLRKK